MNNEKPISELKELLNQRYEKEIKTCNLFENIEFILNEYENLKKQNEVLLESLCLAKQKYKNDKARYRRKAKTYRDRLNKAITYIIDYNDRVMNTENELPDELYMILRGENNE